MRRYFCRGIKTFDEHKGHFWGDASFCWKNSTFHFKIEVETFHFVTINIFNRQ